MNNPSEQSKINFVREGAAGLFLSIFGAFSIISGAMIIFNGNLSQYLPMGMDVALVSSIFIGSCISLNSSTPTIIAGVQLIYCVVTALILASINTSLQLESPHLNPLPTLIAAFSTLTFFFGMTLYLLGRFKLGNLIRFIPYPVISGFLAAAGWLFLKSGFTVITNNPITFANLPSLLNSPLFVVALIGFGYAFVIFLIANRYKHPLVMLSLLTIAFIAFYLVLYTKGLTLEQAYKLNLVLQDPKNIQAATWENYFPFISQWNWQSWGMIQWHLLFNHLLQYFVLMTLGSIDLLLNLSGIEISIQRELDVNKELKVSGIANIVTAIIGGFGGYHIVSATSFNHVFGVKTSIAGLIRVLVFVVLLLAGSFLFSLLPRVIFGILIFYSAFWFLYDWLLQSWKRFAWFDFLIVLTIFLSIACINLLTGFVIGLILAVIIFAMNYSKIKIIAAALDGSKLKSNVERAPYQEKLLKDRGNGDYILILKGFLFFGNINHLVENIKNRLASEQTPCRFLILDCFSISGVDSSAIIGFIKLTQLANQLNTTVVFCALSSLVKRQFEEAIIASKNKLEYHTFNDLDHGLEWVENQTLKQEKNLEGDAPISVDTLRKTIESIHKAGPYFERITKKANETIYHKGDKADGFYYIESGHVEVNLPHEDEKNIRIRGMQEGTIIGEIGMYLNRNRTAEVRSTEPCVLLYLSQEKLETLVEKHPKLAEALNRQIINILANRLQYTTQLLEAFKGSVLGSPVEKGG